MLLSPFNLVNHFWDVVHKGHDRCVDLVNPSKFLDTYESREGNSKFHLIKVNHSSPVVIKNFQGSTKFPTPYSGIFHNIPVRGQMDKWK